MRKILFFPLLPVRDKEIKVRTRLFIAFLLLMVLASTFQSKYDDKVNYFSEQNTFVILPPAKSLRILSFGYRNLVADMIFIWSIQFYSSYYFSNRYDYLEHVFNTITDLTPLYRAPYIVGAWIMALEANDYKMAIRLLQKGSDAIRDEYLFDYEAAFYAFQELEDYALAEKLFKRASKRPNAPALIKRSWAHLVYMRDNLQFAWQLWMDIYKNARTITEKDSSFNHLYQIKYEMDKKNLEEKAARYKKKYGMYPSNLEALLRVGLIKAIPKDFTGIDYTYNPAAGKIKARKAYRWKKSS